MRISDLFDEIEQQEEDRLFELPIRETPDISLHAVRRHVNAALDEDPLERRRHMKQLFKKGLAAALVAASLLTGAFAASQTDFWKEWFHNGTGDLDVNTEKQSIDNGDVRLTLEESISDENRTVCIFSIAALTTEGQNELITYGFLRNLIQLHYNKDDHGAGAYTFREYEGYQTSEKRLFSIDAACVGGMSLGLAGTCEVIRIPTTTNVKTRVIELNHIPIANINGEKKRLHRVTLTEISYTFELTRLNAKCGTAPFDTDFEHLFYFAMKDGSIQTTSQNGIHRTLDESDFIAGTWNHILNIDQIEGIIIGGMEYYLDGTAPQARQVSENFEIVEARTVSNSDLSNHLVMLRPLIEQLGGTVIWDTKAQNATVHYRGVICSFTADHSYIVRDGKQINTAEQVSAKTINGQLCVSLSALNKGLDIQCIGLDSAIRKTTANSETPRVEYWLLAP